MQLPKVIFTYTEFFFKEKTKVLKNGYLRENLAITTYNKKIIIIYIAILSLTLLIWTTERNHFRPDVEDYQVYQLDHTTHQHSTQYKIIVKCS